MKSLDPAFDTLTALRGAALALLQNVPPQQRDLPTALPCLSLIRFTHTTQLHRGMLEPSMCLQDIARLKHQEPAL